MRVPNFLLPLREGKGEGALFSGRIPKYSGCALPRNGAHQRGVRQPCSRNAATIRQPRAQPWVPDVRTPPKPHRGDINFSECPPRSPAYLATPWNYRERLLRSSRTPECGVTGVPKSSNSHGLSFL